MQRDTSDLLNDVLEAARFIVEDTGDISLASFLSDRRVRQLVERNFMVIGEAINRLRRHDPSTATRITAHAQIIAFRNVLIHGYDVIDDALVWQVVEQDLPRLIADVERLLAVDTDESPS